MTLESAAATLNTDLQALQARISSGGWPLRVTFLGTGLSGPRGRATGLYTRLQTADGEEYVFTVTGPATGIERYIGQQHEVLTRALAGDGPLARWMGEMDSGGRGARSAVEGTVARVRGGEYFAARRSIQQIRHEGSPEVGLDSQESNPRPRRVEERGRLHRHTFSIQRRPDGLWTACVCIPTNVGPIYLCATADEHAVAQALQGELAAVSGGRSWAGDEGFIAACGQIAEARATDRLGGAVRSFFNDPGAAAIFQHAVPFIPVVGPAASLAFQGTRAALATVDTARQRTEEGAKARAGIARISNAAKRGDRRAIAAFNALKQAKAIRDGKLPMPKPGDDAAINALKAENAALRQKLDASSQKWDETPLEAADEILDGWGGSDDFLGPDLVQGAGSVVGGYADSIGVGRDLARPMVARYFHARLPSGPVRHECTPEVSGLYHRPMRESSEASLRKDYLRGTGLQTAGFPVGRRLLAWPVSAAPRAVSPPVASDNSPTGVDIRGDEVGLRAPSDHQTRVCPNAMMTTASQRAHFTR